MTSRPERTEPDHPSATAIDEPDAKDVRGSPQHRMGRYRLCFELASGGMATVYLARVEGPAGFEKLVALKCIHPHLAKERDFIEMFLDEARIASRISHPNVCAVFDFGREADTYFLAMEHLVGEPLTRVMHAVVDSHARPDMERDHAMFARIVADAAEGLHAAHELRDANGEPLHVVHRDVSPHNLFVTYDGIVKVVDFGVASARDRLHTTHTGVVKGKYAYMAPEQVHGRRVDRRADVWSLGVVLWELLAHRRLFRRSTEMETMRALANESIHHPSELRRGVPAPLEAIAMRALSRDREARYATARDLGQDLVRYLGHIGDPVGLADLAAWMDALFPEGRARKGQVVEVARRLGDRVPQLGTGDDEASFGSLGSRVVPSEVSRRAARKKWTFALVIAAALASGIGLIAGMQIGEGDRSVAHEAPRARARASAPPEPHTVPAAPATSATTVQDPVDQTSEPRETSPARHPRRGRPSAAPRASGRAAVSTNGTVNVSTPGGWAEVYEGGRLLGNTPLRAALPAGRHVLEVRLFARRPGRRVHVLVRSAEEARVSVPAD